MSMQALLAASQSVARMQAMQSAQSQMQSSANILRVESKQDGGSEKKEAKADALDQKANSLMGDLMGQLSDVNKALEPDKELKREETSKESDKNSTNTDTVELSDSAAKYMGEEAHVKPVVLEAVTYNPDGLTTPSSPAKAAPALELNA